MWRRFRRRTMAPRRPALFPWQLAPALLTALVLVGSVILVILVVSGNPP